MPIIPQSYQSYEEDDDITTALKTLAGDYSHLQEAPEPAPMPEYREIPVPVAEEKADDDGFFTNVIQDVRGGFHDAGEGYLRAGRGLPGGPEAGVDDKGMISTGIENMKKYQEENPSLKPNEGAFHEGLRSAVQSIATAAPGVGMGMAAGAALGGPVGALVGGAAGYLLNAAGIMSLAEYDRSREDALKKGISPEKADKYAMKNALWEGGGEAAADAIQAAIVVGSAGTMTPQAMVAGNAIKVALKEVFKQGAKKGFKSFGKRAVSMMSTEVGSEMVTAGGQAENAREYGIGNQNFWEAAKEAFGPASVASLIFLGFGEAGRITTNRAIRRNLENPDAPIEKRVDAAAMVEREIRKASPEVAAQWRILSANAIQNKEAIPVDETVIEAPMRQDIEQPAPQPTPLSPAEQAQQQIDNTSPEDLSQGFDRPGPTVEQVAAARADNQFRKMRADRVQSSLDMLRGKQGRFLQGTEVMETFNNKGSAPVPRVKDNVRREQKLEGLAPEFREQGNILLDALSRLDSRPTRVLSPVGLQEKEQVAKEPGTAHSKAQAISDIVMKIEEMGSLPDQPIMIDGVPVDPEEAMLIKQGELPRNFLEKATERLGGWVGKPMGEPKEATGMGKRTPMDRFKLELAGRNARFIPDEEAASPTIPGAAPPTEPGSERPPIAGPPPTGQDVHGDGEYVAKVYRGVGEAPSDPGDLGIGEYHTTSQSSAKQYGNVEERDVSLKNPLYLSAEEAGRLAEEYGTLRGTDAQRKAAATKLTMDMKSKGHDGLVVSQYDTDGDTVVVFPDSIQEQTKTPIPSEQGPARINEDEKGIRVVGEEVVGKNDPIVTPYTKALNERKKEKGDQAYFDDDIIAMMQGQADEVEAEYKKRYPSGVPVLYKLDSDLGAMITKSSKEPGKWQLTMFDERGFAMDSQYKTEKEAFKEAYSQGYTVPNPEKAEKQMVSDAFLGGNKSLEEARKRIEGAKAPDSEPAVNVPQLSEPDWQSIRTKIRKIKSLNHKEYTNEEIIQNILATEKTYRETGDSNIWKNTVGGKLREAMGDEAYKKFVNDELGKMKEAESIAEQGGDAKGKEPWEMTGDEYRDLLSESRRKVAPEYVEIGEYYKQEYVNQKQDEISKYDKAKRLENPDSKIGELGKTYYDTILKSDEWLLNHPEYNADNHKGTVQRALSEGKPVPKEVLADYPDLQAKTHDAGKQGQQVVSEEQYLAMNGAGRGEMGEAALHKNIPEGKQRQKLVDAQAEQDRAIMLKRVELRKEYRQKVKDGELRPPTREESLIETANGNPDNEAVRAARRLLDKKGIEWQKVEEAKTPDIGKVEQPAPEAPAKPIDLSKFDIRPGNNPARFYASKKAAQKAIPNSDLYDVVELGPNKFVGRLKKDPRPIQPLKYSGLGPNVKESKNFPKGYAWRLMSRKEYNDLINGLKFYGGGIPGRGNYLAPVPDSASQYKQKGSYLVEFGGVERAVGETVSNIISKENITHVIMWDGDEWLNIGVTPEEKITNADKNEKTRRRKLARNAKDFLTWLLHSGGINPDDKTLKGEFRDIIGKKMAAKGYHPMLFRQKGALSADELTLKAIEDGWLLPGATEDDFYKAFSENPTTKPASMADDEYIDERVKEYYAKIDQQIEDMRNEGYSDEEIERVISNGEKLGVLEANEDAERKEGKDDDAESAEPDPWDVEGLGVSKETTEEKPEPKKESFALKGETLNEYEKAAIEGKPAPKEPEQDNLFSGQKPPRFSKSTSKAPKGLPIRTLTNIANQMKPFFKGLDTDIVVLPKQENLGADLLQKFKIDPSQDINRGLFVINPATGKRTIFLFADGMNDTKDVVSTFLEEAFHSGIAKVIPRKVLLDIYNDLKDDENMAGIVRGYKLDVSTVKGRVAAADEYLAKNIKHDILNSDGTLAEAIEADVVPHSVWQKIVGAVRRFLRNMGINVSYSFDEIKQIVKDSVVKGKDVGMKGEYKAKGVNEFAQPARKSLSEAKKIILDNQNFVKWFGDSKVVDEKGEPLVVYHGTDKSFTVFNTKEGGTRKSNQQLDFGSHFSADEKYTQGYSKKGESMPVYLQLLNPLNIADPKEAMVWKDHPNFKAIQSLQKALGGKVSGDNYYDKDGVKQATVQSANVNQFLLDSKPPAKVRQAIINAGFDGIIYNPYNLVSPGRAAKHPLSYIAFHPTQIKSIYNQGTFDPANPDIRKQRIAEKWYSQMQDFLQAKLPGSGTPANMKQTIKSWADKGEFKTEELEWSGLNEWLDSYEGIHAKRHEDKETAARIAKMEKDAGGFEPLGLLTNKYDVSLPKGQAKVTKQEILDYLRENNVQVQEVVKGDREGKEEYLDRLRETALMQAQEYGEERYEVLDDSGNETDAQGRPVLSYKDGPTEITLTINVDESGWSVYEETDRAFGEVETVLGDEEQPEGDTEYSQYQLPGGKNYKELLLTLPSETLSQNDAAKRYYESFIRKGNDPSWGELNEQDRDAVAQKMPSYAAVDSSNEYKSSHWDEPNVLAHVRFNERTGVDGERVLFIEEVQSDWHQEGRKKGYKGDEKPWRIWKQNDGKWAIGDTPLIFNNEKDAAEASKSDDFVRMYGRFEPTGNIPDAPFKKTWPLLAMKRMVRYAAENGFDSISWTPGSVQADRYDLSKQVTSIQAQKKADGSYYLRIYPKSSDMVEIKAKDDSELEDNVGKDLALKISKQETNNKLVDYEGLDLRVGGEGMKGFYDKILPAEVNKFFGKKAWGNAKVGVGKISTALDTEEAQFYESKGYRTFKEVWTLPITPQMRDKALTEGMPQFQIAHHGTPHVWPPEPGFPNGRPRLDMVASAGNGQAYGHGIYFAEKEETSAGYAKVAPVNDADRLVGTQLLATFNGMTNQQKKELSRSYGGPPQIGLIEDQMFEMLSSFEKATPSSRTRIINAFEKVTGEKIDIPDALEPSLYKLDIPDDVIPKLLDWDKDVPQNIVDKIKNYTPEKPTGVEEKLEAIKKKYGGSVGLLKNKQGFREYSDAKIPDAIYQSELVDKKKVLASLKDGRTGEGLYRAISKTLGSDKAASEFLAKAGIPGNTHGGMSKGGTGAKYVIWSQPVLDRIALLERNQKPLKAMQKEADADEWVRFSKVTDKETLNKLETEKKIKVYRAMQVIDGKLYPPMSAKINGKLREPTDVGKWEQAEENPELASNGKFKLDKANKSAIQARYNPYFHTSRSPLNDQFSSAYKRDNLVTVEVEIPASELTSGYKAEGAKDAVGEMEWHSGPVSSKLPGGKKRTVILSRYAKPLRIVPDSEVAEHIEKLLKGEDIVIPEKVVTPSLKKELVKRGVAVTGSDSDVRFSKSTPDDPFESNPANIQSVVKSISTGKAPAFKDREVQALYEEYERLNDENTEDMADRISWTGKVTTDWRTATKDLADKLYTTFVMSEYPVISKAKNVSKDFAETVNRQLQKIRGKGGISDHLLMGEKLSEIDADKFGPYFKYVKKSLKDSLSGLKTFSKESGVKLKDVRKDYEAMRVAQRMLALATYRSEGPNAIKGLKPAESAKTLKRLQEKYSSGQWDKLTKISEEHRQFEVDVVLKPLRDIGWLSQEAYEKIANAPEAEYYSSFLREMEKVESATVGGAGIVKRIYGSERRIIPSIESTIANTHRVVALVERQKLYNMLLEVKDAPGMDGVFKEVKPMYRKVPGGYAAYKASEGMKSKSIKKFATKEEAMQWAAGKKGILVAKLPNKSIPVINPPQNSIVVAKDGKKTWYEVPPDINKALGNMTPVEGGVARQILDVLLYPTKMLRAGATLSTEFMSRNIFRDQATAAMYSNYGYIPFYHLLPGLKHSMPWMSKYSKWVQEYKSAGAEQSYFVSLDRESTRVNSAEIIGDRAKNILTYANPMKALQTLSEWSEKGTRLGLYINARKKGATPEQAMSEARDSTIDFAKIGSARILNQVIAFWNANVQGTDKMVRSLKDEKTRSKTLMKLTLGITIPTIALWAFNNSDDDRKKKYDALPGWRKIFFWNFITEDGPIISIPKPFELGLLFGSSFEAVLNHLFNDDPKAMKEFGTSLWQAMTPGIIPTTALPILENATNYSFFRDSPIENQGMKNLTPDMRYTAWTPQVFREIGSMTNISPLMIQNWVRGWGGTIAADVASYSDTFIGDTKPKPEKKWYEQTPFIKGMIAREPAGPGSKYLDLFYEKHIKAKEAKGTLNLLRKGGDKENLLSHAKEYKTELRFYKMSNRVADNLSDLRKRKNRVMESGTMSPENKRKAIERIDEKMSDIAKRFVTRYLKSEKENKQ